MPLTLQDWKNAQMSQCAVNASGLIRSLAEVAPRVYEDIYATDGGSEQFAHHPIVRAYMTTLMELCWSQIVYDLSAYHDMTVAIEEAIKKIENDQLQDRLQEVPDEVLCLH